MEQGTDAWLRARAGKVTASRVADVIATTRSGPSTSRKNYLAELVAERLTGVPAQGFVNAAMQWGTDTEPQARAAYEFFRDATVVEVGFIDHPTIEMSGASPDGLVGDDGLVEIKCPLTATHIETVLGATVPDKHVVQMLWQMECTGRAWCDYVSFDPRLPEDLNLSVQRVERDDDRLAALREAVAGFLLEVDATIKALRRHAA